MPYKNMSDQVAANKRYRQKKKAEAAESKKLLSIAQSLQPQEKELEHKIFETLAESKK
jgi:hypothetical protein